MHTLKPFFMDFYVKEFEINETRRQSKIKKDAEKAGNP